MGALLTNKKFSFQRHTVCIVADLNYKMSIFLAHLTKGCSNSVGQIATAWSPRCRPLAASHGSQLWRLPSARRVLSSCAPLEVQRTCCKHWQSILYCFRLTYVGSNHVLEQLRDAESLLNAPRTTRITHGKALKALCQIATGGAMGADLAAMKV